MRDLGDFNEVGSSSFRKDNTKLGGSVAQHREAGADDGPLRVGVMGQGGIAGIGARERTLEALTERRPIGVTVENKVVHPAIAVLEHIDELVLSFLPVVIAPRQKSRDGRAQRRVLASDLLESAPSGAAVELVRLRGDVEAAAETGEERLLQCEVAAERVDGLDAELRGKIEEVPAQYLRVFERTPGDRAGFVLSQLVENTVAHLRRSRVGKGDGEYLPGFVNLGEQTKKPL